MDLETLDLERFVKAQHNSYEIALHEIKKGRKESHWMWYIFPQLKELGHSYTAQYYGIQGKEEAEEYLKHPILSKRLFEISETLLELENNNVHTIFDFPDDMKLRSCMTLFYCVSQNETFKKVLDKYYHGKLDKLTVEILNMK